MLTVQNGKKVLITEFISSDESGEDDGHPVFVVKKLPWRSESFERLDAARSSRKTEQASRQTKPLISRVYCHQDCSSWVSKLDSCFVTFSS